MSYYPDWRPRRIEPPRYRVPGPDIYALPDVPGPEQVNPVKKERTMISKYYKGVLAFVGILGTSLGAIAADPDISSALPTGWGAVVVAAGSVVGTLLVVLKRNEPTVEEAEAALARAKSRAA